MRFRVVPMCDRGVRLPPRELARQQPVAGNLLVYQAKDETTGNFVTVAVLHGDSQVGPDLLPPLRHVEITGMAPLAFGLRGVERIEGRRGPVDVLQEWWVRPAV